MFGRGEGVLSCDISPTLKSIDFFATFVAYNIQFFLDTSVKRGLHIVRDLAEHACGDASASKRISKVSTYRLKIFVVKYQNL